MKATNTMANTDKNDFCILHHIDGAQVLIDTTFNHKTESFELSIKFWLGEVNGYTTVKMEWSGYNEGDFNRAFEEMKDIECVKVWISGVKNQFT